VAPTKHPLDDDALEDVDCIDEDKQETLSPVQKSKKGVVAHVTKLKSIKGYSITKVAGSMLKKFCAANNVLDEKGGSLRNSPKHVICDRIVWYLDHPKDAEELVKRSQTITTAATTTSSGNGEDDPRLPINKIRLLNVIFGEAIRPELQNRARTLNKDEMTEGLKTGHDFC
jgi:hypothetical protein